MQRQGLEASIWKAGICMQISMLNPGDDATELLVLFLKAIKYPSPDHRLAFILQTVLSMTKPLACKYSADPLSNCYLEIVIYQQGAAEIQKGLRYAEICTK